MSIPFRVVYNTANNGSKILSVRATRPITTHSHKGNIAYKNSPEKQQQVIDATYEGAAKLGFDDHGAVHAEIAGGFHDKILGGGPEDQMWITVQMFDANGKILYHKKQDGSEWDRIHLFKDPTLNQSATEKPVTIYTKD